MLEGAKPRVVNKKVPQRPENFGSLEREPLKQAMAQQPDPDEEVVASMYGDNLGRSSALMCHPSMFVLHMVESHGAYHDYI